MLSVPFNLKLFYQLAVGPVAIWNKPIFVQVIVKEVKVFVVFIVGLLKLIALQRDAHGLIVVFELMNLKLLVA